MTTATTYDLTNAERIYSERIAVIKYSWVLNKRGSK